MPKKKIIKRQSSRNNPMNLTGEYLNQKIKSKARTLIPTKSKKKSSKIQTDNFEEIYY